LIQKAKDFFDFAGGLHPCSVSENLLKSQKTCFGCLLARLLSLAFPVEPADGNLQASSNGADFGQSSVQLKFTPIRVVCQNTLTMALSKGENVRVSHTAVLEERLELAKQNLGIIHRRFTAIEAGFRGMINVPMVGLRLDDYVRAVFPEPADKTDKSAHRRVLNLRERAKGLFEMEAGNGLPKVRGTL